MKLFASLVLWLSLAVVGINATSIQETPKIQNVEAETLSSSSLRVTWDSLPKIDENDDLVSYNIRLKNEFSRPNFHRVVCTEKKCSYNITYLDAFTEYSIKIEAYYYGNFAESDEVFQFTAEGKPEPPDGVKCETLSSTEIRVSWQSLPLESLHGTFAGYKVYYHVQENSSDPYYIDKYKETTGNETILNGLKKNTVYEVGVVATTLGGEGIASHLNCKTDTDVPDEPIDVKVILKRPNGVQVLWHPPLETNGDLLNYTIYYQMNGTEPKTGKALASQTSYEISGLEPHASYEFWVTATTKSGEGLASDYITMENSCIFSAQIATYGEKFTVKFKEPVELLCDAVGSPPPQITWMVNGDNIVPNQRMEIAFNGSLIIKSVIREDANNYTCIAENKFGNDSITHQLIVEAPPKAPEITILNTTTNKIVLQLKPNSTDSASIESIKLYYKLDSEIAQWKSGKFDGNNVSLKIDDCNCGSSYLIYAIGCNKLGDGDASETITIKTNGSKPSAPEIDNFIEPSTESVTLHLGLWNDNICPISHFFVSFRKKGHIVWTKIRNKLRPHTDFVLNLEPATQYNIRVTAHNAAGSTVANYEIVTLTQPEGILK